MGKQIYPVQNPLDLDKFLTYTLCFLESLQRGKVLSFSQWRVALSC